MHELVNSLNTVFTHTVVMNRAMYRSLIVLTKLLNRTERYLKRHVQISLDIFLIFIKTTGLWNVRYCCTQSSSSLYDLRHVAPCFGFLLGEC